MVHPTLEDRTLTRLDHNRVSRLLAAGGAPGSPAHAAMQDMLDSSDIVPSPAVPASVVTMNSRVLLQDECDGKRFEITVCYPRDADPSRAMVSVLSPAGTAVLGLQEGAVARWRAPGNGERAARVLSILYQPEAAGDYVA